MGILERIADIEFEMSRTQKHKGNEHHLGLLKARLAKYVLKQLTSMIKSFALRKGMRINSENRLLIDLLLLSPILGFARSFWSPLAKASKEMVLKYKNLEMRAFASSGTSCGAHALDRSVFEPVGATL